MTNQTRAVSLVDWESSKTGNTLKGVPLLWSNDTWGLVMTDNGLTAQDYRPVKLLDVTFLPSRLGAVVEQANRFWAGQTVDYKPKNKPDKHRFCVEILWTAGDFALLSDSRQPQLVLVKDLVRYQRPDIWGPLRCHDPLAYYDEAINNKKETTMNIELTAKEIELARAEDWDWIHERITALLPTPIPDVVVGLKFRAVHESDDTASTVIAIGPPNDPDVVILETSAGHRGARSLESLKKDLKNQYLVEVTE